MASVDTNQNNPNDPNNPNNPQGPNQPAANQQTNQPATSGGAGAVSATGAGNVTGQVVGTANPSQPFQNIASYLTANAPQSEALAAQVASSVANPIAQTTSDIANTSQGFTDSVNKGYTPENTDLTSAVAANPTTAAATPGDIAAFQAQLNDTYTGPTALASDPNYSNLESEIANAQALGTNALTPTGIQTLLQSQETPDYTQGINNLDTLLLAQNPANATEISNAGLVANNSNNALQNFLTTQTTQDDAAAQAAQANGAAASANAGTALNPDIAALAAQLNNELQTAQTNTSAYDAAVNQNTATLDPIQAALTQFEQSTGQNITNPLTPYLNETPLTGTATPQTVATPQDYSTMEAIQSLLGTSSLPNIPITPATQGEAGSYSVPVNPGAPNVASLADALADSATETTWGDIGSLYGTAPGDQQPGNTPYWESQALGPIQGEPNATLSALEELLANLAPGSNGYITPSSVYGTGYYTVGSPTGVPPPVSLPPAGGPPYLGPTGGGPTSGFGA